MILIKDLKLNNMKNIVVDLIYPLCAVVATIGIWGILIELEKINKKK
jgi:hypothetical protein